MLLFHEKKNEYQTHKLRHFWTHNKTTGIFILKYKNVNKFYMFCKKSWWEGFPLFKKKRNIF